MRPIGIAALVSVIGLVACSDMPPPIAKDLHGDAYTVSAALDQRAATARLGAIAPRLTLGLLHTSPTIFAVRG
jgi:hypothetical protein